jgi:uncharacterized membrane protein required for colicin V production
MNIPIIVFGFVVLFFVWRGYQKGFAVSVTRYFSCLLAYLVSILFTNSLSKVVEKYSHLEGLIVYFAAAGFIFFLVTIVANYLIGKLLKVFLKDNLDGELIGRSSRFGGAFLGVMAGCFVGLLMVYVISFSQKMTVAAKKNPDVNSQIQEITVDSELSNAGPVKTYYPQASEESVVITESPVQQDSFIESVSKRVVSGTLTAAANLTSKNPTAKTLTQALSHNPEATFNNLKNFVNDQNVHQALADPDIQNLLSKGNAKELLKNQSFRTLINNKNMKTIFAGEKEEVIAESMVLVWRRVDSIKNNPRVIEIMSDEDFIEQINSANTMQLLTNPKLKELADIAAGK